MKLSIIFVTLLSLHLFVEASAVTPIQKVIQLLTGMMEQGKKEKHDEAVQFAAYSQFCSDTETEKARDIVSLMYYFFSRLTTVTFFTCKLKHTHTPLVMYAHTAMNTCASASRPIISPCLRGMTDEARSAAPCSRHHQALARTLRLEPVQHGL